MTSETNFALKWWQKAVFYQIYPHSFADGNSDGIGDFPGMITKLDYLKDLGIDAIWLSPHYPSPFIDCGYDIADYCAVGSEYGTLDDFKVFLAEAHRRGMRIILDHVLNHTSDQHHWFLDSRSSRDNPKRDWYIWKDGTPDSPPNNWNSYFGGSAWEYDPLTSQSYYHLFLKEQPDLNWRNPAVKQAMLDATRFWLDMGVDGFRLDAISTIFEHPDFPDHLGSTDPMPFNLADLSVRMRAATTPEEQHRLWQMRRKMFQYQGNQPGIHELMQELRSLINEYPDAMLVGEVDDITYYGNGTNELHMVFNFPLMRTDHLTPAWVRANQKERLGALPALAWPCNTLGNHDNRRLISHFGDGVHDQQIARLALALMLTLRGTPFLYNGEEIGMNDLILQDFSHIRDFMVRWQYAFDIEQLGLPKEEALVKAVKTSRDRCRTPMQWENAPNAGFCPLEVSPWLPVNPNYAQGVNVGEQINDPDSMLNFYKRMLSVRRNTPALIAGDYTPLHEQAEDYLAFLRTNPEDRQTCLVVLNFSENPIEIHVDSSAWRLRLVFSTQADRARMETLLSIKIAPFEIYIAEYV